MQLVTAGPRSGHDRATVLDAIHSTNIEYEYGLERLNSNLQVVEDLTPYMRGGKVTRIMSAMTHGSCSLHISKALDWGTVFVRPYSLQNGIRFNHGVYALITPKTITGADILSYEVVGYDRLYTLNREVGDTWVAGKGEGVLGEVERAASNAGVGGLLLDGTARAKTLPKAMVFPLIPQRGGGGGNAKPATWLYIINELLKSIGYRALWADENGFLRSEPWTDPKSRGADYLMSDGIIRDSGKVFQTLLTATRTVTEDPWRAPNKWIFVRSNYPTKDANGNDSPPPSEGNGIYTVVNQSDGITSIDERGVVWPVQHSINAADQASLVTQGNSIVSDDRTMSTTIGLTTAPFPLAWHEDVFDVHDYEADTWFKVKALRWDLDLRVGANMPWLWERIA